MSRARRWLARLAGVVGGERRDREFVEELEFHLRMEIEEQLRRGLPPAEARRVALLRSGGIDAAREAYREQRSVPLIDDVRRDLRHAVCGLRRSPGFAVIAVASLALGIGANTAVFSLTDAVFLRRLPVSEPGELVLLEWTGRSGGRMYDGEMWPAVRPGEVRGTSFAMPFFDRIGSASGVLTGVFAFAPLEQLNVVAGEDAAIARGQLVTGAYYTTLGVQAVAGRLLEAGDDRPGADPVAVLTYGYWQSRFGGDRSVIGRQVLINSVATTIIGVTPARFVGTLDVGETADVTLPMSMVASIRPGSGGDLLAPDFWWVRIMGRRASGVTSIQVAARLAAVFRNSVLEAQAVRAAAATDNDRPELPRLQAADGSRGASDAPRDYQTAAVLLSVVAALILLIACANVANLMFVRAAARQREITIRSALGASRGRILRQLLLESVLLVFIAEAAGLLFAGWAKDLLLTLRPGATELQLAIDARAFGLATVIGVGTALLAGFAPALHSMRTDVASSLRLAPRTMHGNPRAAGRMLVALQIALSVVLLTGAALFLRTLQNLRAVDAGFEQNRLLLFRVDPRLNRYDGQRIVQLYRDLQRELGSLVDVQAVTFSRHALLTGGRRSNRVDVVGQPASANEEALVNMTGPQFFTTMQIPIMAGRAFDTQHHEQAGAAAIINQTFARTRFPGTSPIGQRVRYYGLEIEVLGVAADAKYYSLRSDPEPTLYLPFLPYERGQASFAIRTRGDPMTTLPAVRDVVRRIDPTLAIFDVATQRSAAAALLGEERLLATMTVSFGVLALILACIGVYGVVAWNTTRRTGEIGLRIALGATGAGVLWLAAQRTLAFIAIGIIAGLAASIIGARFLDQLLFGLEPTDPLSITAAAGVISIVALVAVLIPADRARRVSPLIAIRHE